MKNDNEALVKLGNYITSGKSYFEATTLLKQEGFTQLQINNATFALKSGRKNTDFNPKLADSITKVATTITKDNGRNSRQKGIFVYPGGGFPLMRVGGTLNSWWYFVPFLIVAIALLLYFGR